MATGTLAALSPATVAAEGEEPEEIKESPDGKHVIVCDRDSSKVTVYSRNEETGKLTKVETFTFGEEAYGVAFTPDGKNVYIACQKSTKIGWYSRNAETGVLTKKGEVAGGEQMHCLTVSADGKNLYAPAYKSKAIYQYKIEASGEPVALSPAKVEGVKQPHNMVITANGEYAYCSTGEAEGSVVILTRNTSTGALTVKENVSNGGGPGFTEIVRLGPEDKTVYAIQEGTTNGGVVVFTRNTSTGALTKLEKIELGKASKDIAISPDGLNAYITEQSEAKISEFSRNPETGALTALSPAFIEPGESSNGPSFVIVSSDGHFVYAAMKEGTPGKVAQLSRTAPVTVTLGAAASTTSASLSVTAPTRIPLNSAASTSAASLALGTPVVISLNPAVAKSGASLGVRAGPVITLAPAASVSAASLLVTAPAVPKLVLVPGDSKPPLEIHAELVYPDGTTIRWDKDAQAKDRPTGITIRTQRHTGFADAQLALNRRIDLDYPDLGLLDGMNLIGHEGSVAYEGRIGTMPRSLQGSPQVGVQLQGWMSHAKDEPFTEVYVDRDLSKWTSPSAFRTAALIGENFSLGSTGQLQDEAGNPALELSLQGSWVSPYHPRAEAWWLPQPGISIGALYYAFTAWNSATMSSGDANWVLQAFLSDDDKASNRDLTASLWGAAASGYLTNTAARACAGLFLRYANTPAGSQGATYYALFEKLAVYGAHGLTRRGGDPGGFYVSDMIVNIANRFAPKLDTSRVEDTTFAVPQASFTAETFPYDSWQTLNTYHRWEMAVYEKRQLLYYPIDLGDWDWEVRLSDPGTTVSLQGDDSTTLCNGVIVRYTDLGTGYETRLTPDDFPALQDTSPDNPANLNGLRLYTTLTLSVPTTQEGALQIGHAYLAEFNQAPAPGSITITGHIRDRAGHWQQGWKVRSSDRLVISDLPNDSIRVVGETEWNHDSKTLTIAVDSSFKRLDAILARLGVAVEAANLSLP